MPLKYEVLVIFDRTDIVRASAGEAKYSNIESKHSQYFEHPQIMHAWFSLEHMKWYVNAAMTTAWLVPRLYRLLNINLMKWTNECIYTSVICVVLNFDKYTVQHSMSSLHAGYKFYNYTSFITTLL